MASSNAGPITGAELIRATQDGQQVYLTRPQVVSLLAFTAQISLRSISILTERMGDENFRAVQGGGRIEMNAGDFATYLAGTATPQQVPSDKVPAPFSGRERLMLRQGASLISIDLSQVLYVRGLGGSLGGVGGAGATPTPTPNIIFSAQSPWNSFVEGATLSPNTIPTANNTPWVEDGAFSSKAFYAAASDGPVTVYGTDGGASIDIANQLEPGTVTIPRFPTATSPAVGTDGHCEIVDLADGAVHSFYQLVFSGGKWKTSKYAKTSLTGRGFGTVSRPDNVRAAGCSTLGGLLTKAELGLDIVPHALAMSMDRNAFVSGYTYPATLEDYTGYNTYGNITGQNFPMGSLMMLPASFNAEALALPTSRAIARTLKKYGAYVIDATVGAMNFYAEIGSGWNRAYASGSYDSNFGYDMEAIKAAIRRVTSYTAIRDRDGLIYTPPTLKGMNLISMRGPWTGEYGSVKDGQYDAVADLYTIGATGAETRTLRELIFTHSETEPNRFFLWKGQNSWNLNPEIGATYKFTAFGTGDIQVTANIKKGDFSASYGTTGKLSPGQSYTFVWPNTTDTVMEVYIDKAAGATASIRLEMVKV